MPVSLEPAEYVERLVVGEITDDSPNLSSITFFFPANDEKRGFKTSLFFTPVEVDALNAFFNLAISISFVFKILFLVLESFFANFVKNYSSAKNKNIKTKFMF